MLRLRKFELYIPFVHNPLRDRQQFLLNKHRRRRSKRPNRYWSINRGGFWEYWVCHHINGYGRWVQVKKHGVLPKKTRSL